MRDAADLAPPPIVSGGAKAAVSRSAPIKREINLHFGALPVTVQK